MKTLHSLFVLMIGLSPFLVSAQKADSVIVIYDNQKTVIPVPAFGSQTTVKMADSIQIIEIGVLRKRAGDKSPGVVHANDLFLPDNKSEKARKQVKWFSQIEAGYKKSFSAEWGGIHTSSYTNQDGIPVKMVFDNNLSDITGYQLRILLRENETMLNKRISFNSGFKLGYAQSFSSAYTNDSEYDTAGYLLSDTSRFYNLRSNNFQLVYEAGFAYHFQAFKLASKIIIGNSFNYSIVWVRDVNDLETGSNYLTSIASLVNPYLGAEIGKFGFIVSMDWNISSSGQRMYPYYYGYPSYTSSFPTLTTSLTFRLF